ncbi:hypothetical protein ILUMI_00745 [Ignelater luminosus]|uniref:Mos1 transposase HTH domain-containing protein n=1 Tax=Ignelater luminosus TaxID=2038154 RepID=A0A8K0GMU6_IGNLU|nr:hypothetical protein ILUMI_00745 [Ignelater luminosus]
MATWLRDEIRTVLKYNFLRGLSIDKCVDELKNAMGDDCPHQTTVFRWYREFQGGDFSTNDKPRSGRLSDVVTPEVINKVSNLITENRRISYPRKACTLWVPHSLTVEQMACRVVWCKQVSKDYAIKAPRYLNNFVTGDETWSYYYDVRIRCVIGILTRIVLDSQHTVTAFWYVNECLTQVVEQLKKLRPRSRMDIWHFHYDNARLHAARRFDDYTQNRKTKSEEEGTIKENRYDAKDSENRRGRKGKIMKKIKKNRAKYLQ